VITKVTKENKALYQVLFEKVNKELGLTEESNNAITSLDQYFNSLVEIVGKNEIYGILPLDEPTFDIDANTRQINVPDEFRKNGISVQGDQISEIIYFTIDRFVDAMDLFLDEVHIIIQWETAASKGGPSERGYSVAYLKDISLYKTTGKMLFGWAINNSITKNAGSIKFSVRFYKFNSKQELDFSLSTLTAQATINPGLDFTWNKDTGKFAETIYDDS